MISQLEEYKGPRPGDYTMPVIACYEADVEMQKDAARYRWLRARLLGDDGTPMPSGVFIGLLPDNLILNGIDADTEIDLSMQAEALAFVTTAKKWLALPEEPTP